MIDDRAQLIAAFVFVDLVGAWLWFSYRAGRERLVVDDDTQARAERPRISLHADPQQVLANAGARSRQRRGTPPPLR